MEGKLDEVAKTLNPKAIVEVRAEELKEGGEEEEEEEAEEKEQSDEQIVNAFVAQKLKFEEYDACKLSERDEKCLV